MVVRVNNLPARHLTLTPIRQLQWSLGKGVIFDKEGQVFISATFTETHGVSPKQAYRSDRMLGARLQVSPVPSGST